MQRQRADQSIVFDNVARPNDLQGTFKASVLWAQSQITPINAIFAGHPHLTARRQTLLMVKPLSDGGEAHESLNVRVVDNTGTLLGSVDMSPPSALPETAYRIDGIPDELLPPDGTPYVVDTQDEASQLDDPTASFLLGKLKEYPFVRVELSIDAHTSRVYLPEDSTIDGKHVLISTNIVPVVVFHSGRMSLLAQVGELLFVRLNGYWFTWTELEASRILYAENMWTAALPAHWIVPGITMHFESGQLSGDLIGIHVGGTTQLLIHTIDIGMLVEPRGAYPFADDPSAHREYFQTVPISQLVVSQYQSCHLTEVMLPDGTLLREFDPSEGGWHTGTMRERTGKELISRGINEANYGIHSAPGIGETTPLTAAQLTAHNSRGRYANGVQVHGGSEGNGVVTLDQSLGNEFSHEAGHNYGLGHYPGGFAGSVHRDASAPNSTWGWDADKNIFLPNFSREVSNRDTCLDEQCQPPFHGRSFGYDPMAGGAPMAQPQNRFTLHTPHTAQIVQRFLENKAVFSVDSPTRFRRWNAVTEQMEPYDHRVDVEEPVRADNRNLSESAIAALLSRHRIVTVEMYDGDFARDIYVPAASPLNARRVIEVNHDATLATTLHINGNFIVVQRGYRNGFISNGTTWVACIVLRAGMIRAIVPNAEAESSLTRWLANYSVLHIVVGSDDWVPSVDVPPASQANRSAVITLDNSSSLPVDLRANGLITPVPPGGSVKCTSTGSAWQFRTELIDLSIERRPLAFGIPVTTIVGYYDPDGMLPSYINPALHGAYGLVYPDDSETIAIDDCQLWVQGGGDILKFKLNNSRLLLDLMNRFSVNVPESASPRRALVLCRGIVVAERIIDPVADTLTYTVHGDTQLTLP